ncbi:hypothetical protein [Rhodococcus jostii]|uniref:Uncharacterized protein n=1 Tax=Rhodococcus jostii TaxID=132919 RepID=A0ABU4CT90_RHOJO|nr:hypothetical protein [Rhodococcus jostii]MDV6286779.1 hypothetical protein [Rhodococcus jostii]
MEHEPLKPTPGDRERDLRQRCRLWDMILGSVLLIGIALGAAMILTAGNVL